MLTGNQAEQITTDCIRRATGYSGQIKTNSVLNTVGVVDAEAREAVNDEIVTASDIGVKRFGYRLGQSDLTFTSESKFFELRDEIAAKATQKQEESLGESIAASAASTVENKKDKKKKEKADTKGKTTKSKKKVNKENE